MSFGTGKYVYELVPDWAKIPAGWEWQPAAAAAVDAQDNVHVFIRGDHPVTVFDRSGNFLRSWGEGIFSRPHGIFITPDQLVWTADDVAHVLRKFDMQGRLLETMGTKGKPSDSGCVDEGDLMQRLNSIKRGAGPFNRPTKLVVAPWGERYVSDGYGNARVHRFTAEGALINSWGSPGHGPGEFFLPHGLAIDSRDRVLVADRENSRIQIFSREGKFLDQWTDLSRSGDLAISRDGVVYISESGNKEMCGMCIRDLDGNVLSRFKVEKPKTLRAIHSFCIDSRGDIYVCEPRTGSPTIKKFVRK
jgi:DNA-binding beta-propeller fold protein YncE